MSSSDQSSIQQISNFVLWEPLPQVAFLQLIDKNLNVLFEFVFVFKLFTIDIIFKFSLPNLPQGLIC